VTKQVTNIPTYMLEKIEAHQQPNVDKCRKTYLPVSGIKKIIVDTTYEICTYNNQKITPPISLNSLVSICNSEKGTIKTTRNRLINEDGILIMELDKDSLHGRGAVMCYSFSEWFWQDIKNNYHRKYNQDKRVTKRVTGGFSSSSSLNTTTKNKNSLPNDWRKLSYKDLASALSKVNENFGLAQIQSIYNTQLETGALMSANDVQVSINNFTYTLENNPKSSVLNRRVKVASLLETLKNGEIYLDPMLLSDNEKIKKEKIVCEKQKIRERYFEKEFEKYFKDLSLEKKQSMIRSSFIAVKAKEDNDEVLLMNLSKEGAREIFKSKVWPELENKLLTK